MRLQEGIRLNEAERVNALRSRMRKAAIEIAKHQFFKNIALRDIRFAHQFTDRLLSVRIIISPVLSKAPFSIAASPWYERHYLLIQGI